MGPFTVSEGDAGTRLDRWLSSQQPELSRSRVQALIREGHITVGGRVVKPHQKLAAGMEVHVAIPPLQPANALPENIPLSILYEDADILVINKPAGQVVHPAPGHAGGTLVNALLYHCRDLSGVGGQARPGIVHRLDKDTSGALVVAKNDAALQGLMRQFKGRQVRKEYLAAVRGRLSPSSGRIQTLIGRSEHDRKKMTARPRRGREAVTEYDTVEAWADASLVRVRIETGRTHQIRVHMSHLGHAVLGDAQYGRRRREDPASIARQMLHAARIAFAHPRTGKPMEFEAPLPDDMRHALEALRAPVSP